MLGYELEVLNDAETPPFPLNEYSDVGEETRLRYRFIDLRRPEMAEKLKLRSRITASIRRYLDENGFLDVETPILGRPTPEGARDYLVPSRTHAGNFFALPQSPQLFKQLLMVAGFDRYYQIAKCFRDEDLRADRQPEFTQIDIETSFLDEADIIGITEGMIRKLFKEVLDLEFGEFPHMPFEEAMRRYGSDKPDLRIPLELVDVADQLSAVEFKVFSGPANDPKGRVAALRVPGAASMPRSQIDDYTKFVGIYGAKGLAYIKVNERAKGVEGLQSPIVKFIPEDNLNVILDRVGAVDGDIVFFGADKAKIVSEALGALRIKLGHDLAADLRLGRCGWSTSRCSRRTTTALCPRCIIRSRRRSARRRSWKPTPALLCRAPTTWCSMVPSWVAARSVSTARKCSRRCSVFSASTRPSRRRSSASCSMR